MPLNLIQNQPLFPNTRPTDILSCDQREYCHPFIPTDKLRAQFQQTPCSDSIICDSYFLSLGNGDNEVITDPEFDDLLGDEVLNGTFTGNANNWNLETGWAYNTNKVTKSATVGTVNINQLLPSALVITGIYEVKFTVANYGGSGTLQASIGAGAGGSFGTQVNANGNYTQYIKCDTSNLSVYFFGTATFTGDLDNITVRRIAATWDFGFWFLNASGQAVSSPGSGNRNLTCHGVINQPNTDYLVEIDFDASTAGGFEVLLGSTFSPFTPSTGGGTISFTLNSGNSGNNFAIVPSPSAVLIINSISVKTTIASGECWTFDEAKWTLSNEKLCKIPGSSDTLTNAVATDAGVYYQLKITVSGRTAGSITPSVANYTGDEIKNNGTFTQYFKPTTSGSFSVYADALFDGCVSAILLYELKTDYIFKLQDLDNNDVANITAFYYKDFVTINQEMQGIDAGGDPLPFGCYRLHVFDQCQLQYSELVRDGRFDTYVGLQIGSYWPYSTPGNGVGNSIEIVSGKMVFTKGTDTAGLTQSVWNCPYRYPDLTHEAQIASGTHNYKIEFDIVSNSDTANQRVVVEIAGRFDNTSSSVGHHVVYLNNVNPNLFVPYFVDLYVKIGAYYLTTAAGVIEVDNFSIKRIEPYDTDFLSECISYGESFKSTTIIEAECDAEQMGFLFYDNLKREVFKLTQRLYLRSINPSYPEDTDDYLFSDGTKSRNYGKSEKSYTVLTDAIDETSIDALAKQRICQRFYIGEKGSMVQWIPLPSDLVPEWIKNGDSVLAPVRFEVQEKIKGAKFFRNS